MIKRIHKRQASKQRAWQSARPTLLLALCLSVCLSACSGLGYTPPPGAKLGDAFLGLTIKSHNNALLPQGADIVISIEDAAATEEKDKVIIGDVIKLTQSDTAVKVNFPIDKHRLSACGTSKPCQIHIKIVKQGSVRFIATKPEPYKAGQNKINIRVAKPI